MCNTLIDKPHYKGGRTPASCYLTLQDAKGYCSTPARCLIVS